MKAVLFRSLVCLFVTACLILSPAAALAAGLEPGGGADPVDVFLDIPADAWYRDAVRYVVQSGYFEGVSETAFAPKGSMTRAMLATVIWRMAGRPLEEGNIPFSDVKPDLYYTVPVIWAARNGIINGTSDTSFEPNQPVTRVQAAAMLHRYAALQGCPTDFRAGCSQGFPDEASVPQYGKTPVQWAVTYGILNGRESDDLAWLKPNETITRAEAACVLQRFDAYVVRLEPVPEEEAAEAAAPESRTTLWVDGKKTADCPVWGKAQYLSAEAFAALGNGAVFTEGNLKLTAFGHTLYLSKTKAKALLDGQMTTMSAGALRWAGSWYVPASALLRLFAYDCLEDREYNQSFYTRFPKNTDVPAGKRVVVLRYHCVSDDVWGSEGLFMSPQKLEQQIVEMKAMGCSFLTFEDLDKLDQYKLPVLLTFDDGYADNYTELFPILKRQNVRATVFMITAHIGRAKYLTAAQLLEMSQSGLVSVQSHTHSHASLSEITDAALDQELNTSRLLIARATGKQAFVLSYPKGIESAHVQQAVASCYQFAVLANTAPYLSGTNPYAVSRFGMPRTITTEQWKAYFQP